MTLHEAITALFDEFQLDDIAEIVRDDVKADPAFEGLSQDHPRVRRFREVCQILREALAGDSRQGGEG